MHDIVVVVYIVIVVMNVPNFLHTLEINKVM